MEIRIGIQNSPRELSFESNESAADLQKTLSAALESSAPLLSLSDAKGVMYLVPTASIAYVEVGADSSRRVGFVS